MKTDTDTNRLRLRSAYSLAAAAAAGTVASQADAAVRYSGVQDLVIEQFNAQNLSIDGDAYGDILLKNYVFNGGNYQGALVSYSPGRLVATRPTGLTYASALEEGFSIDATSVSPYYFLGSMAYGFSNPNAEFNNANGAFLGLSFPITVDEVEQLYYGWVRVTIDNDAGTFVINDWAFNDEPGVGILAGEMPGPLAGDFNDDGQVDLDDYVVWRNNLGGDESTGVLNGNGNNDGLVDTADYASWKANFGQSNFTGDYPPPASAQQGLAATAVPEPGTLGLLAAGALGVAALRRRKASHNQ